MDCCAFLKVVMNIDRDLISFFKMKDGAWNLIINSKGFGAFASKINRFIAYV